MNESLRTLLYETTVREHYERFDENHLGMNHYELLYETTV
jgi:hypothetical protein